MGRILKTREEVQALMQRVLSKDDRFSKVKVGPIEVHARTQDGSNWSLGSLAGPDATVRRCLESITPVVRELQSLIDVDDEQ